MASILILPDDCLHKIISFIEVPSSFHSITLTCQRFLQVTKNTTSVLHSNLLRAKAEYLIKCCIVENRNEGMFTVREDLIPMLRGCARLTAAKKTLTPDRVADVWQQNGPVAAKLFTWIRELHVEEFLTGFEKTVTLHLPSCKRNIVIQTRDYHSFGNDDALCPNIDATCGDLNLMSGGFPRFSREDNMLWKKEDIRCVVDPMRTIVKLLQKELGETVPPITDHFFVWLCCFFPDNSKLLEGNRLSFKDDTRNTKPTSVSLQTLIDEFHKELQFGKRLQDLLTQWNVKTREKEEWHESKYPTMIEETFRLLAQRSETKILEHIGEIASRFVTTVTGDICMIELPNQVVLDLFLRTSLEASTCKLAMIANKYVERKALFRCFGGKVMKVRCSVSGSDEFFPQVQIYDDKLEFEFSLPDGKLLKLESPLDLEILGPVTDLLQECSRQTVESEQQIPKIGNFLTATYFLNVLDLTEFNDLAFDSFLALQRFPESGEESDDFYLEDSPPRRAWTDDDDY